MLLICAESAIKPQANKQTNNHEAVAAAWLNTSQK